MFSFKNILRIVNANCPVLVCVMKTCGLDGDNGGEGNVSS